MNEMISYKLTFYFSFLLTKPSQQPELLRANKYYIYYFKIKWKVTGEVQFYDGKVLFRTGTIMYKGRVVLGMLALAVFFVK